MEQSRDSARSRIVVTGRYRGTALEIIRTDMPTKDDVISIIKEIIDPELFIDIWTLGLIYDIEVDGRNVDIKMTFTSVACPAGPELVGEVKSKLEASEDIDTASVEVVFDPPWQPSEDLKALMGIG